MKAQIAIAASVLALAAFAPPAHNPHRAAQSRFAARPLVDSLSFAVENPMSHPVTIAIGEEGKLVKLGEVFVSSTQAFRIPMPNDSVIIWATNDDMGMATHKVMHKTDKQPILWTVGMGD